MARIVGAVHRCRAPEGADVPLYALTFDADGVCTSPRSREVLLDRVRAGDHTDVVIASHGWNTTPRGAIDTYRRWMSGYGASTATAPPAGRDLRPVVVGVVWPSTWMVPLWERGPRIAAGGPDGGPPDGSDDPDSSGGDGPTDDVDEAVAVLVASLAATLDPDDRARVHDLVDRDDLDEAQARELAGLLVSAVSAATPGAAATSGAAATPGAASAAAAGAAADAPPAPEGDHHGGPVDPEALPAHPDVEVLMDAWRTLGRQDAPRVPEDPDAPLRPIGAGPGTAGAGDGPEVAGRVGRAPADLLRLLSVWQMKDRAAAVGARGVADTLRGLITAGGDALRIHAIGHSFGCKVLLSAIASPRWAPLPTDRVDSLLLLQPAVSGYAFAEHVPEAPGQLGGYHDVPRVVRQPVCTTFSAKDLPLRQGFHLALRRPSDLTEAQIAADEPPSPYAALGGYGPRGVPSVQVVDMPGPGEAYPAPAVEVLGLRAHRRISGHGDHDNPATHWALRSLMAGLG